MLPATAAFKLSTFPLPGIEIKSVMYGLTASDNPFASFPMIKIHFLLKLILEIVSPILSAPKIE